MPVGVDADIVHEPVVHSGEDGWDVLAIALGWDDEG